MKHTYVLIHSPLMGPVTWRSAAEALKKRGHNVVTPNLNPAFAGAGPYYPKVATLVAGDIRAANPKDGVVLVAHSGAGGLMAAIAGASPAPVRTALFVDAMLPHQNKSWTDHAPIELTQQLFALAKDGKLPTWDKWFAPDVFNPMLPDARIRQSLVSELTQLPMAYFSEVAPPNEPIKKVPIGYLQLSESYQGPHDDAEWMKWSTRKEMTDHFGMLTKPDKVAAAIEALTADALKPKA
jgi:pimeloyl-ACP methyl ester carboxylesterase